MNSKQDQLQAESVRKALEFFKTEKYGYLDLAMRYGKCKVTLDILRKFDDPVVLIAYPDNQLKNTWQDEMKLWKYEGNIWFTNFRSLEKFKALNPDFFIIDEFHDASDNERDLCQQIMTSSPETKVLALSGTVSKETEELWGLKLIDKYSTLDGISDGILADYQITVHYVDLDTKVLERNKKGKWLSEKKKYDNYTFVINKMIDEGRNATILTLARNRLSLSSIGKMNYLKKLLEKLKDKRVIVFTGLKAVADNIGIPSYHSESPTDKNLQDFKSQKTNKLALAAMGKVGVTYPNLDSVILLNFTYNKEESSQILNRAIKLDYNGKIADLHVLCLNEPAERKKLKESLSMLDQKKIKYYVKN